MTNSVQLWKGDTNIVLPSTAKKPADIVNYAVQLSDRDRRQISKAFSDESYEMALTFVWTKSMAALKRDLSTVGLKFLGEILGKNGLDDDDNPTTAISHDEAIMLAEELGVVSSTEAMRLRHSHELLTHFLDSDGANISSEEEIEREEAVQTLKTCVRNILGKNKNEVSAKFATFRAALEERVFKSDDLEIQNLLISPYFFKKITLNILVNSIGERKGAKLENILANLNVILPVLWANLKENERWTVGREYANAHGDGEVTAAAGLKSALMKVKGFDYVPENLRSNVFVKAAEKLIELHEAFNNFYNEPAAIKDLRSLGTTIPIPAFSICSSAIFCVYLGNSYGVSAAAVPIAYDMLKEFSDDRWKYYFNDCLPSDARVLNKLSYERPRKRFVELVRKLQLNNFASGKMKKLLDAAAEGDIQRMNRAMELVRSDYYGKEKN
ncbi:hypothetical protein [Herbaspirillum huttiense]|uniref:hypothetical protein n=1 Tax=Herbaspirillum huttiense TaxID=863372 RepID=UPI00040FFBC1|nr:hypothetical protein [Herbaspirillum huttiense]